MAGKRLPFEKCYPIRNRVHEQIEKLIHAEEEGSGKKLRKKLNQKCKPP